jgi:hypothetical protein
MKELTLLRIEFQAGLSEPLKHFPHVQQVLLENAIN